MSRSANVAPTIQTEPIHTLSLKPLKLTNKSLLPFWVNFSPNKSSEASSFSTLPSYNSDGKHFTPAFYLSSELNQLNEKKHWQENFYKNFQNKKNQSTLENKHLFIPKPQSKYCQICHEYFQDYIKHTAHSVHTKKFRQANDQLGINQLIQYFKQEAHSFKRTSPSFRQQMTKIYKKDKFKSNESVFEQTQKRVKIDIVVEKEIQFASEIESVKNLNISDSVDEVLCFQEI